MLVPANRAGPIRPKSSFLFLLTSPGHNSNNYHSSINKISSTSYWVQGAGITKKGKGTKHCQRVVQFLVLHFLGGHLRQLQRCAEQVLVHFYPQFDSFFSALTRGGLKLRTCSPLKKHGDETCFLSLGGSWKAPALPPTPTATQTQETKRSPWQNRIQVSRF